VTAVADDPIQPAATVGALPHGALPVGTVLGRRYALGTLLARGGMADVWHATDLVLERPVAVKVLHPHLAADDAFVRRFRTEALAAARLQHPSIVAIFDTVSDGGVEAIVLELVEGVTLRQWLDHRGPLDPSTVARLGGDVAGALEAAHRNGVIHRDVKPANILVCPDHRVKVADFGIAKVHDTTDHTQTGTMLGSVKYLSPEQVDGLPVDARSDVYSLGIVLYEALTGRTPFEADTPAATALGRLHHPPTPPRQLRPAIPAELEAVVLRALARDPAQRYGSAAELCAALAAPSRQTVGSGGPDATAIAPAPQRVAVVRTTPVAPPPHASGGGAPGQREAAVPTPPRPRRRWGLLVAVLGVVIAALAVVAALLVGTDPGEEVLERLEEGELPVVGTDRPPPTVSGVQTFDPQGSGEPGEMDPLAPLAIDGDGSTVWQSEGYDSRTFGNLKEGVGLVVLLDEPTDVSSVEVLSPTRGWAAEIYVAPAPGSTLADWGDPVARADGLAGDARFEFDGVEGGAVLVWITDLGDAPPRVRAEIAEIVVG
jgi:serine/threonine-protein kinase